MTKNFFPIIISFILIKNLISTNNTLINNSSNNDTSTNKTSKNKPKELTRFQKLIKWGINNSLNLSEDLSFSKKNKFIAKKFITIDDIIMEIPQSVMLNVKKALRLLNSSKLKKQYQTYIKEDKESREKKQAIEDEAHVDQSFLSYLLYLTQHRKKKYEKTEFYKYLKNILYMFEDNLDNLPFSY